MLQNSSQPSLCSLASKAVCDSYGAGSVEYSPEAEAQITAYTAAGFDKLPVRVNGAALLS